ncbi:MAG: alpha/beta hydrolase, partial [Acidimicrobiia bacterium]|nr:alpha/beta hydrolase [Acidimicrobiia bacterium]
AGLSVTHTPPMPMSLVDVFDQMYADRFFYILHFQAPGVAEAEFEADVRASLKKIFHAGSAATPLDAFLPDAPRGDSFLSLLPEPPQGPLGFLSDADLDVYAETFARTGLTGAFNRYRALPLDGDALADIHGAKVSQPACFIGGAQDMVRSMVPGMDAYARADRGLADSRGVTIIDGAGHWVQQEAPDEVNAALHRFLQTLDH